MARSRNSNLLRRGAPVGRWKRRGVSVLAALLMAVVGSLIVAPPAQAIAVSFTSPVPGEEVVPVGTNVTATFDVAATGVSASTFTLSGPAGNVPADVSGSGTSWTLNPTGNLQDGVTYTATLASGITGPAAEALAQHTWQFTTGAPPPPPPPQDNTSPTVESRSPGSGATGVGVGSGVSVTFSEEVQGVDQTTFRLQRSSTGTDVSAIVFRRGTSSRWSLSPDNDLLENTEYTARLTGGPGAIRDLAGNALASTSWSFRTGPGDPEEATRPRVTERSPRSDATGVPVDTTVTATFNEAVVGVDESTFTLERASTGTEVPAVVFRRLTSSRWRLSPEVDLREGTRYVVRLFGGPGEIRDLDGNTLSDTEWSFTTDDEGDDGRPEVIARSPRSGATGISRHIDVRVTFNEIVRGVNSRTFRLTNTRTGNGVSAFVFRNGSSRHWALDPDRALRRDTRYLVTLRGNPSGIRDVDGNRLARTTWSFRIRG